MDQKEFRRMLSKNTKVSYYSREWYMELEHFVLQNIMQPIEIPAFQELKRRIKIKSLPSKDELEERLALLFGDPELMEYYYNIQDAKTKTFIKELTWNRKVHYDDAKAIFKEDLVKLSSRQRYGLEPITAYKRWHPYLSCFDYGYSQIDSLEEKMAENNFYYMLPDFMRMGYAEILPKPKGYYLEGIQVPKKWLVFQTEAPIFEELPAVLSYIQQDKIKRTAKGYLSIPSVRAMQKKLNLSTFPNDPGYVKSLLINGMMDPALKFAPSESIPKILRYYFLEQHMTPSMLDAALFPLSNVRKVDYYEQHPGSLKAVFRILSDLPQGGWISYQNIHQYAVTHFFGLYPISNTYIVELGKTSVFYDEFYDYGDAERMEIIQKILITGALLMAAAYGLLDLAYDPDDPRVNVNGSGYYEDLLFSACRLTPLGAHIMQDNKDYVAPAKSAAPSYTLSPDSFQIHYSGNLSLATGLLDNWISKTHDGEISFDLTKVLKNTGSESSFRTSIEKFKKSVGTAIPDYWNRQFEQVLTKSSDLRRVTDFFVFKISPEATYLHQLIAKDEVLRKLIIKAERYFIIVDASNKQPFYNRLAALGYLPGLGKAYTISDSEF